MLPNEPEDEEHHPVLYAREMRRQSHTAVGERRKERAVHETQNEQQSAMAAESKSGLRQHVSSFG